MDNVNDWLSPIVSYSRYLVPELIRLIVILVLMASSWLELAIFTSVSFGCEWVKLNWCQPAVEKRWCMQPFLRLTTFFAPLFASLRYAPVLTLASLPLFFDHPFSHRSFAPDLCCIFTDSCRIPTITARKWKAKLKNMKFDFIIIL